MVSEANRRGGLDNITVIVVKIEAAGATGEQPAITLPVGARP